MRLASITALLDSVASTSRRKLTLPRNMCTSYMILRRFQEAIARHHLFDQCDV